jgi:hypothetical protein
MLEVEFLGNGPAISQGKAEFSKIAQDVRGFQHRGLDGAPGILGFIGKIVPSALPGVFNLAKSMLVNDRDLKIKIGDAEFIVRDLKELDALIELLSARGLLQRKDLA